MTGAPLRFDEPPRICPRCLTNNWRTGTRELWDPGDEERGFPAVLMQTRQEIVCGTCNPGPKRIYVDGVDPDAGRGPFNL